MRVRETGRGAGLSHEPLARLRSTGEVRRQDLDGDVAIELHVAREVHHPHAASAELALERVLAGQGGLEGEELVGGMGHGVIERLRDVRVASRPAWKGVSYFI